MSEIKEFAEALKPQFEMPPADELKRIAEGVHSYILKHTKPAYLQVKIDRPFGNKSARVNGNLEITLQLGAGWYCSAEHHSFYDTLAKKIAAKYPIFLPKFSMCGYSSSDGIVSTKAQYDLNKLQKQMNNSDYLIDKGLL